MYIWAFGPSMVQETWEMNGSLPYGTKPFPEIISFALEALLLTWINLNPSMDK